MHSAIGHCKPLSPNLTTRYGVMPCTKSVIFSLFFALLLDSFSSSGKYKLFKCNNLERSDCSQLINICRVDTASSSVYQAKSEKKWSGITAVLLFPVLYGREAIHSYFSSARDEGQNPVLILWKNVFNQRYWFFESEFPKSSGNRPELVF